VKAEGESTQIECLALVLWVSCCRARQSGKGGLNLVGRALRGGYDGIMDSSKFGVIKCFVEIVKTFWIGHVLAFSCHVIDACHL